MPDPEPHPGLSRDPTPAQPPPRPKFSLTDFPAAWNNPLHLTVHSAWNLHLPMIPVIMQLLHPRTFVELGTHAGDSYMGFCQAAINLKPPTICAAVDTWQGDTQAGYYGPEFLADLKAQHDPHFLAFSRLLQTTFDDAATQFAPGSIDLLHIDGLHTYDAVRHDYDTWFPKLSDRAVVLLHDTAEKDGDFGVWKLWDEITPNRPHFHVPYGHGLGILAVGPRVPAPFLDFLDALRQDPQLLALFHVLGNRVELLRNCIFFSRAVGTCLSMTNSWRQTNAQTCLIPNPTTKAVWDSPIAACHVLAEDIKQLVADAQKLLQMFNPPPQK